MIKKKHLSRFGASARPPEPEPSKTERPAVKAPKEPRHDPYDIARANERQSDFHWGWQDRLAGKPMTSAHSPAYCSRLRKKLRQITCDRREFCISCARPATA